MYDYLQAQIQYVRNNALTQMYQSALRSADYQAQLYYGTQNACCDAYHLRSYPDSIRCCVLSGGAWYGF